MITINTSEMIHPEKSMKEKSERIGQLRGSLTRYDFEHNNAKINIFYSDLPVVLEFLDYDIVRITTCIRKNQAPTPTVAIKQINRLNDVVRVDETDEYVKFTTGRVTVAFEKDHPSWSVTHVVDMSLNGDACKGFYQLKEIRLDESQVLKGYHAKTASDRFYGLGEKTGFLNKQGERYEMWNSDIYDPHVPDTEALYVSIPFLIHAQDGFSYGLLLDNPGRTAFDMRSVDNAYVTEAYSGELDCYFIPGPSIKDVVSRYTSLTGRIPMPPKWALGYHQSRYSYFDQEEVLDIARTLRDKRIPCDAIHLDIHHMDGYRVFTFDPDKFPNPAAMISQLSDLGFHVVPIVDPGVKCDPTYQPFVEGSENGMFCTYPDGTQYTGPVWPGESAFPDFTDNKVSEWWGGLYQFYTDIGVRGIWNDMNEPSVFNDVKTMDSSVIHRNNGDPRSHGELHNLYGLLMAKSTYSGLRRLLPEQRPFVLTRAAYAGIQRYGAVWTGDNRSYWEHMAMSIPMLLNLGLSGVPFVGSDIGGFSHHTTGELLARWTQLGAFYPFSRNHSCIDTRRQEPWTFGPEVEEICRRYIQLRYEWLPHIYSLFYEAFETGLPVIRPLVLEHPSDPRTFNLCDEFLLGCNVLVAPVLRPGDTQRLVYIPEGTWYDYWTGEKYVGNSSIIADAPLHVLPLYVRAGSIVAKSSPVQHTGEHSEVVQFHVYLGDEHVTGRYRFYEDDGCTYAYENGKFNLTDFELFQTSNGFELTWGYSHQGYNSPSGEWIFQFTNVPEVPSLHVDGLSKNQWTYDSKLNQLVVRVPSYFQQKVIHVTYSA